MEYIKDIVRGMFIGIANIIPGVSGGTMAVSMGVYDKIIHAVTNIKKEFKTSIKTLLPYAIGCVLGIVLLSFVIKFLFANYKMETIALFIGLILGGLPPILKKVENETFKVTHLISFAMLSALIILPSVYSGAAILEPITSLNIGSLLILLVLGFISAGAMVIPGVSGSMILMMLGYYEYINNTLTEFVKFALKFDIAGAVSKAGILFPFGIGVLIGIFVMSKIIEHFLKKYPNATYWGIIGLVVSSPFAILMGMTTATMSIATIAVSILTFLIGFFVSNKLTKM